MNPQMWRTVRWFVALAGCALVVVLAVPLTINALSQSLVFGGADDADPDEPDPDEPAVGDGDADPVDPPGEVPSGPVTDGQAAPEADLVVRGGVVRQATAERLVLSEAGDVVVALFPLVQGDPACVTLAELEFWLEEADPTEIAVYASTVSSPLDNGDEVDDPRLDPTVRALAVTDGTPGRLRWDVTDLYRAWASAEIAPAGAPFAVVLAPPGEPVEPPEITFASAEAGAGDAPALVWEGEAGCG